MDLKNILSRKLKTQNILRSIGLSPLQVLFSKRGLYPLRLKAFIQILFSSAMRVELQFRSWIFWAGRYFKPMQVQMGIAYLLPFGITSQVTGLGLQQFQEQILIFQYRINLSQSTN